MSIYVDNGNYGHKKHNPYMIIKTLNISLDGIVINQLIWYKNNGSYLYMHLLFLKLTTMVKNLPLFFTSDF